MDIPEVIAIWGLLGFLTFFAQFAIGITKYAGGDASQGPALTDLVVLWGVDEIIGPFGLIILAAQIFGPWGELGSTIVAAVAAYVIFLRGR